MEYDVTKEPRVSLCRKCKGSGQIQEILPFRSRLVGKAKFRAVQCPQCKGTGRVIVSCTMRLNIEPYRGEVTDKSSNT